MRFRVVAVKLLQRCDALHIAVQALELVQLREQVVEARELAALGGEVQLDSFARQHLVGFGQFVGVKRQLHHLANGVTCGFPGHAGLIHHHQQGRQHLAGLQALLAQERHHRADFGETLQHVGGVHAQVVGALDGVHQAHHVALSRLGGVLHL